MNAGDPMVQQCRWQIFPDADTVQAEALHRIDRLARDALTARAAFHLVLAGGTTPVALYSRLDGLATDWSRWHIYFGDERCLPPADVQRNSVMARSLWLDRVPIPEKQIHVIPAELGAAAAAGAYASVLAAVDLFDLVLLGLGEDGHTASLFPGHALGTTRDAPAVMAVLDAPKPPSQRVTLSAWRLSQARAVLVLVTGTAKRAALSAWRRGASLPVRAITPATGVDVLADAESAAP